MPLPSRRKLAMVIFNFPFWIFLRALSTFGISFRPMDCIFPSFTIGASSVLRQTPAWLKTVDAQCWDQNYCSSLSQNRTCTSIFLPIHPCHTNLAPRTDAVKPTISLHSHLKAFYDPFLVILGMAYH